MDIIIYGFTFNAVKTLTITYFLEVSGIYC
jgi:hypothetical protein